MPNKNPENKYNVYLTHLFSERSVVCGQMTKSEILEYIKKIGEYSKIPPSSCLYSINARFQAYEETCAHIGNGPNIPTNFIDTSSGMMTIKIQIKNCGKCHPGKCMDNIKTGKCIDDFMRSTVIGKKLFQDEYKKQK